MHSKITKDMATLSSSIVKRILPTNPATSKLVIVGQKCSSFCINIYMEKVTFKRMSSNQVVNLFISQKKLKHLLHEPSSDDLL